MTSVRDVVWDPYPADLPPEWEPTPERFRPMLLTTRGLMTTKQQEMLFTIVRSRWFLLPNSFYDRNGERLRAKRHDNVKHEYITVHGIPAPFHSLSEVIGKMHQLDGTYVNGEVDISKQQFDELNIDAMVASRIEPITRERAYHYISEIRKRGSFIYPEIRLP